MLTLFYTPGFGMGFYTRGAHCAPLFYFATDGRSDLKIFLKIGVYLIKTSAKYESDRFTRSGVRIFTNLLKTYIIIKKTQFLE